MADVLGEASKANNMNATWTEIQPELQLHIDSWKECDQDGNKYTVFAYVFNPFCTILNQIIDIKICILFSVVTPKKKLQLTSPSPHIFVMQPSKNQFGSISLMHCALPKFSQLKPQHFLSQKA